MEINQIKLLTVIYTKTFPQSIDGLDNIFQFDNFLVALTLYVSYFPIIIYIFNSR